MLTIQELEGMKMKIRFGLAVIMSVLPCVVQAAGTPQWTWEAGTQTNNGAITIKSTDGVTTYAGTQNPTANTVRINQNAATQPPTVVIPNNGSNQWSMYYRDRVNGLQ